jgi:hypothetical protein
VGTQAAGAGLARQKGRKRGNPVGNGVSETTPGRVRTCNLRFRRPTASERNPLADNTSGDAATPLAPVLAPGPQDPDLDRVVAAWPTLPVHVRQTIATLITAAAPGIASAATNTAEAEACPSSPAGGPGGAAGAIIGPSVEDRP